MRKLAHVHCFHKESCPDLPKMDRSSLFPSLLNLGWKWSSFVFCSFHNAFPKATLYLLLDFRDFSLILSRRFPEDVPRCIRQPKYRQICFSGCVVWIHCKATVMGTSEWSLWESRRETSELSGLWNQGFCFQSVQGPPYYSSRLVDR